MTTEPKKLATIHISYAQKDEELKQEFEDYLAILQEIGLLAGWTERQVCGREDWSQAIDPRCSQADLLLLLISPALLGSGYCSGAEVREALARSRTGKIRVVPIVLLAVSLSGHPLASIQSVPRRGIPVASWANRNEAWQDIDHELRFVLEHIYTNSSR